MNAEVTSSSSIVVSVVAASNPALGMTSEAAPAARAAWEDMNEPTWKRGGASMTVLVSSAPQRSPFCTPPL